jgi:hypothetical protein
LYGGTSLAFHRCHQAEFTDDALEARFDCWAWSGSTPAPGLHTLDGFHPPLRDAIM